MTSAARTICHAVTVGWVLVAVAQQGQSQATNDRETDVRLYGVRADGQTDDTQGILSANDVSRRLHLPLYFPRGRYVFNGENLAWAVAPRMDSEAVVVNHVSVNIIPRDDDGVVLGLQQKPLEVEFSTPRGLGRCRREPCRLPLWRTHPRCHASWTSWHIGITTLGWNTRVAAVAISRGTRGSGTTMEIRTVTIRPDTLYLVGIVETTRWCSTGFVIGLWSTVLRA